MTEPSTGAAMPRSRDFSPWVLGGIVLAYALISSLVQSFIANNENFLSAIMLGVLIFEPVMMAIWTALGPGSIFLRVPLVLPCLLLLFVAPGYVPAVYANTERAEFTYTVLAGFGIYIGATFLFLLFRRLTRFQILPISTGSERTGLNFSLKYLLALLTLYGVSLGMATQLKFTTKPPGNNFLGNDLLIWILLIGGSAMSIAVLPTTVVPLSILYGRPSRNVLRWSVISWAFITSTILFFMFDVDNPLLVLGYVLLAQIGAAGAGALTAWPLRLAGLRLVRTTRSPEESAAPPPGVILA